MRIGTLFSGIGAPEQGAYRVYGDDLEMVFACEYDKFARKSFTAIYNFDGEHFHNDVRQMDGTQYRGKVDVLVAGSPCQAFSIAGLRNGTDDERGQLIYQYIRIVDEVRPPVIVYENVKGMLSIGGGSTIREFVQALRDIGYFCHYEVVNTKDYGVPQNRERIFLVGFVDHEAYHRFSFAPKIKLEKRLKDVLESEVDEKYYLNDAKFAMDAEGVGRTLRIGGKSSDSEKHCFDLIVDPKIFQTGRGFNNGGLHYECPTITKNSFECNNFVSTNRIRKLTPLECWRLQDFPDEAHEKAKQAGISDSQRYKQAGNSMSVNVLEMIFRQIEKALRGDCNGRLF
jgi:DNA (cytosine-5)-methyltransferase 1